VTHTANVAQFCGPETTTVCHFKMLSTWPDGSSYSWTLSTCLSTHSGARWCGYQTGKKVSFWILTQYGTCFTDIH